VPTPSVAIPGLVYGQVYEQDNKVVVPFIAQFVSAAYRYLVGISAIAAAIMVVYGFKDGTIKGSLRSTRPEINVARLAQGLGGGGHRQAAGFTLRGRLERTGKGWRAVL
jgi:nanoRNase/pAp phosphatase (c-di-AMP/oligoRNAs hydrolase)